MSFITQGWSTVLLNLRCHPQGTRYYMEFVCMHHNAEDHISCSQSFRQRELKLKARTSINMTALPLSYILWSFMSFHTSFSWFTSQASGWPLPRSYYKLILWWSVCVVVLLLLVGANNIEWGNTDSLISALKLSVKASRLLCCVENFQTAQAGDYAV